MIPMAKVFVLMAAALALTACTTTDPYTGQTQVDPNSTAALIGGLALAGAAAYALSDDDDDDDRQYYHQRYGDDRYHYDYDRNRYQGRKDRDWRRNRHRKPPPGVVCDDRRRACYSRGGRHLANWSERVYGYGRYR